MTIHVRNVSQLTAISDPENAVNSFSSWFSPNQISRDRAQELFEYDGGRLLWRSMERRRRPEAVVEYMRKSAGGKPVWIVALGSRLEVRRYLRRYLVWNWHFGETDRELIPLDGDGLNDRIENIGFGGRLSNVSQLTAISSEGKAVNSESSVSRYGAKCPCCGGDINTMTADLAIQAYGITEQEARVLRAIWSGNGGPVRMDRVFFEMYSDDPDGGPPHTQMYNAFKVALSHLRSKLDGSGIKIETVGYRQGYRLLLERE